MCTPTIGNTHCMVEVIGGFATAISDSMQNRSSQTDLYSILQYLAHVELQQTGVKETKFQMQCDAHTVDRCR